jgi:hypothetical protein
MDLEQTDGEKKVGKRGRKPKVKDGEDLIKETQEDSIKKKRGRKPTGKIYEINKSLITSMGSSVPNCIIAHLPLSDKDIEKIIGKQASNTNQEDFTMTEDNLTESISDIIQPQQTPTSNKINSNYYMPSQSSFVIEADDNIKNKYNDKCMEYDTLKKKYDDLIEKFKKFSYLEDKITDNGTIEKKYYVNNSSIYDIDGKQWADSTSQWCKWCSHGFDTVPIGLPEKYCPKEKKYYLRDCFCSFNCAAKYNFEIIADYKVHERFALLNNIKKQIFKDCVKSIIPAGPRELLTCFGGEKSIDEFRSMCIPIPKEYNHLIPPMIPIFTVIEEIPKFFYQDRGTKKKNDFSDLKIKRTKPLLTQNNNLLNLIK